MPSYINTVLTSADMEDPKNVEKFREVFDGLHSRVFNDPKDREPFEASLARIQSGNGIAVIREEVSETGKTVVAYATGNLIKTENNQCIWQLFYTGVDPDHRRQGHGHEVFRAFTQAAVSETERSNLSLGGIISEPLRCDAPGACGENPRDTMDARDRLRVFCGKKFGGKIADFDYYYPWLNIVNDYHLVIYPNPKTGEYASWGAILGYVTQLYKEECGQDYQNHPVLGPKYKEMKRAIQAKMEGLDAKAVAPQKADNQEPVKPERFPSDPVRGVMKRPTAQYVAHTL